MPFLTKAKIILDPSGAKATFKDHPTIIRCSATTETTASAATTTSESDHSEEISAHLSFLKTMREAVKVSDETLQQPQWNETIKEKANTLLSLATIALNKELPDFKKEFPEVFPEKIPIKLPPLRPGLNHTISLDETRKEEFRNEYRPIPQNKIEQLGKWLQEWQNNGIAVRGPAYFAAPIFAIPKRAPAVREGDNAEQPKRELRWLIDLRERNKITRRDYTPIPNQKYIRDDVARHPYRSKIDMSVTERKLEAIPSTAQISSDQIEIPSEDGP